MNFDGEFTFPENEFQFKRSWVGVTPIKPIPGRTQRPIYVDERGNQLGRSNWQEHVGFPSGYAQEMQNCNGTVPNFSNQNMLLGLDGGLSNRNVNLSIQDVGLAHQNASLSNRDMTLLRQNVILSDQDTGLSNQNASLSSQNAGFANQNIGLSNLNASLPSQNVGFSNQNISLSNRNVGFPNQNAGLTNWNVGLSNQNVSLSNRNSGYSNQNIDLLNRDDAFSMQNTGLINRYAGLSEHNVRFPNQNNVLPNRDANQNTSLSIQDVGFSSQNNGLSNRYPGLSNPEHFPNQNTSLSDRVVGLSNQNVRLSNGNVGLPQRSRMINQIANSYVRTLDYENSGMHTITLADILAIRNAGMSTATSAINRSNNVRSMQQALNLQAQSSNHQYQSSSIGISPVDKSYCQSPSVLNNSNNFANIPQGGFPQLNRPQYNLNSPPTSVNEATTTSINNSFYYNPDQTNKCDKNQLQKFLNSSVEENLSHEKNKQDNREVSSIRNEAIGKNNDELSQNIVHTSPVAVTSIKETNIDGDQGIDLNKTPQQKTPKRRKHRPKVVREGKSKRAPKPVVPPDSSTKQSPSGKRKYVRKTNLKSTPPKENAMGKNVERPVGTTAKSCRRVLKFDKEKTTDESHGHLESKTNEIESGNGQCINLNTNAREIELYSKTEKIWVQKSAEQMNQYNGVLEREMQEATKCSLSHFKDQMLNSCVALPNHCDTRAPATTLRNMSVNNLNSSMSIANTQHYDPRGTSQLSGYGSIYPEQVYPEGLGQIFFQPKKTDDNLDRSGKLMLQSSPQSVLHNMIDSCDERISKRKYQPTMDHINPDTRSLTSLLCQEIINVDEYDKLSSNLEKEILDTQKRRRSGSEHTTNLSTFMYSINDVEDCSRNHSSAQNDFVKQYYSPELVSHSPSAVKMQSNRSTQVHNINSMDEKCSYVPMPPPKRAPASGDMKGVEARSLNITKETTEFTFTCLPSSKAIIPVDRNVNHSAPSKKTKRGKPKIKDYLIHIDAIISRFESLKLDDKSNGGVRKEQKALVPYKAAGTIIPYEGFQVKKRKPRPRVNLDPETERLWKLLMGKEQSESSEGTDKDKEKWWEEERRVFRGRADSFIARMHLVQGDRRFSRWKGSVVDSVIGVFLTQNVSDHLSSSAFISLAARFPIRSSSNNKACYKIEKPILVEEPDDIPKQYEKASSLRVCSQIPPTSQEMLEQKRRNPTLGPERTALVGTNERTQEKVISTPTSFHTLIQHANGGIRLVSVSNYEAEGQGTTIKSSQSYISVSTNHVQPRKVAMSHDLHSSGHESPQFQENLEHVNKQNSMLNTVDRHYGTVSSIYPTPYDPPVGVPPSTSSNYQLHNNPHTVVLESWMLGREAVSSQPYYASDISKEKDQNSSVNVRPGMESTCNPALQGGGLLRQQELLRVRPNTQLTNHAVQQNNCHLGNFKETNQHSFNSPQRETTHLFHWKNTSTTVDSTEAVAERGNITMQEDLNVSKLRRETFEERTTIKNNKTELANNTSQQKVKEQKHSLGEAVNEKSNTTTIKTQKGKVEGSQKSEVDWDVLRKQVEFQIKRERASEAMDSLDYEALRCADVKKISDTIKERGMNNMLAERMKAFLNRLVKDHGSIDLEWLRDAPPDKAKEYLLSIRGLGLKSVECVRLLTLHHLAFPVDTNVGRIAVRLGWVPLQPLPESLQLHLLEMYPVLESIQKYLWPRLCKLDQRTLYELHYQMITFGKVFCTKSKPNCNACPMRAECRHFASAFASARLALPGPEEKGIVHSSFPIHKGRNPDVVINQVPLLTPGEDIYSRGRCEPIIEVPATPEPECIEISESDIEDAFYEDPDEIPSINLNIEEFTQNLQCYMEENSVVQDGEMSKALVALNSAAASLPTPRLKNVSRLRTEHQVYELPDSHPLLKGLERREPDDPSPYLLAIWTPGETADSAQPPENKCTSEDPNKLCDVQTCVSCNSTREANSLTVRGTLLIPCRTAMRGSFPLNGTYFQVNEMFADHESSLNPIDVPRAWIWNLQRRTVYFGTSVSTIFKGLTTEGIQYCFWRGFVCVRGFDQKLRTPRPLLARLHLSASKLAKSKNETK